MASSVQESSKVEVADLKPIFNGPEFTRARIIKNLLVTSVAWLILYGAYDGLTMLQSTLNSKGGIGVVSVAVQFAFGCASALLFSKYLIKKLGNKRVIIVSMLSYLPLIAANAYPDWIVMVPTSVLLGLGSSLLWAALGSYLTHLSFLYTEQTKIILIQRQLKQNFRHQEQFINTGCDNAGYERELNDSSCDASEIAGDSGDSSDKVNESQPINFEILETCGTSKSFQCNEPKTQEPVIDYSQNIKESKRGKAQFPTSVAIDDQMLDLLASTTARFFGYHGMIFLTCYIWSNMISYFVLGKSGLNSELALNSTCVCGAEFCNYRTECFENNLKPPKDEIRYILIAVFFCFGVLAVLLITFFLDDCKQKEENTAFSLQYVVNAFKHMKKPTQFFLIPLTMYVGLLQGFIMGDYSQAYVGCSWGIHHAALVNVSFGFGLSFSSYVSGWLIKYLGRPPIFLFTAALNVCVLLTLSLWRPTSEQPAMMLVVGAILGYIFGAYWSQTRALYGVLFKGAEEEAFGNYEICHSGGAAISFASSSYLCTFIKIYILFIVSSLGIAGYLVVERIYSKSKRNK